MVTNQLFISYSHVDRVFVDQLAARLTQAGFRVWYDQNLKKGLSWSRQVENELKASTVFLVVLTPSSVESEAVRNEIHYAKDLPQMKRIIPLLREDCTVPLPLMGIHWIEGRAALDPLMTDLVRSLQTASSEEEAEDEVLMASSGTTVFDKTVFEKTVHVPQFHFGGVVPPEYFIGRNEELVDAESILRTGQSFLLVGVRRAGKTSFCKKLIHDMMGRESNSMLMSYLNLESCRDLTIDTFLTHTILNMTGEIARQVFRCKHVELNASDLSKVRPDLQDDATFQQFYHLNRLVVSRTHFREDAPVPRFLPQDFVGFTADLLEIIRARGWSGYVILYDEANHLPKGLSVELVTENVEALDSAQLTSLYAATPEMMDSFCTLDDLFGHQIHIGPFDSREDMLRLLARYYHGDDASLDDLPITEDALDAVWNRSQGRPFQMQFLLGYSFKQARRDLACLVVREHVDHAWEKLVRQRPEYFGPHAAGNK